jgi:hypothetical protein
MKKIREWLNELPVEIRQRAIRNAEKSEWEALYNECSNDYAALNESFHWPKSPEGDDFWREWYVFLKTGGDKPTIEPADGSAVVADHFVESNEKIEPMTKREQFAMAAMQGTNMEAYANAFGNQWAIHVAKDAVIMADALIAELNKTPNEQ